jgi:5,10-methylenetetrahydromethanopterin reductase
MMPAEELAKWCKEGEGMGFDSVWLSEDPYYRDCLPLMTVVAESTRKVRVATSIVNFYTKHPVYMAMAAATIDEISGGRLVLGIGRGVRSLIEGELGISYGSPLDYAEEYLQALRKLLDGEKVTMEGELVRMKGVQLHFAPLRKHLPILLAAMGPKTLTLASRLADGAILNSCTSVRHAAESSEVLRASWKGVGEPELVGALWVSIDEDKDRALDSMRTSVGFLLSIPTFGELFLGKSGLPTDALPSLRKEFRWDEDVGDPMWHLSRGDPGRVKELVDDRVVDALTAAGTVEECRKRIREYHDVGVTTAMVNPMTPATFAKLPELLS